MAARSKQPTDDFATALARYQARPPRYTGEAEVRRRDDWWQAVSIGQLSGDPPPDESHRAAAELWITGRVTKREYVALSLLAVTAP